MAKNRQNEHIDRGDFRDAQAEARWTYQMIQEAGRKAEARAWKLPRTGCRIPDNALFAMNCHGSNSNVK